MNKLRGVRAAEWVVMVMVVLVVSVMMTRPQPTPPASGLRLEFRSRRRFHTWQVARKPLHRHDGTRWVHSCATAPSACFP